MFSHLTNYVKIWQRYSKFEFWIVIQLYSLHKAYLHSNSLVVKSERLRKTHDINEWPQCWNDKSSYTKFGHFILCLEEARFCNGTNNTKWTNFGQFKKKTNVFEKFIITSNYNVYEKFILLIISGLISIPAGYWKLFSPSSDFFR